MNILKFIALAWAGVWLAACGSGADSLPDGVRVEVFSNPSEMKPEEPTADDYRVASQLIERICGDKAIVRVGESWAVRVPSSSFPFYESKALTVRIYRNEGLSEADRLNERDWVGDVELSIGAHRYPDGKRPWNGNAIFWSWRPLYSVKGKIEYKSISFKPVDLEKFKKTISEASE